jgi:hypothetical protein
MTGDTIIDMSVNAGYAGQNTLCSIDIARSL